MGRQRKGGTPPQTCVRLALSGAARRRLWAESGGYCSNPECGTFLFDESANVDFAQMAHIIAASAGGPRDLESPQMSPEERAQHSNIVVLCANCHMIVDKSPGSFPAELLTHWKERHENTLQQVFGTPEFPTRPSARSYVAPMLEQNRVIYDQYGPSPGEFSEARTQQWHRHVVATMVPNNAAIGRALKRNLALLGPGERRTANIFDIHSTEFAARHLLNDWTAGSTRFPEELSTIFEGDPA